jgi:hypothetical protein
MIPRTRYLNYIRPFIDKPLIKVITGVRRCGKSVFLTQIADLLKGEGVNESNILLINKELLEFDFIKNYQDLYQYINGYFGNKPGKFYLFVDEVQEIGQWERCIASLLAENRTDIYITGSNASMFSSELATLLSGRYIQIMMYPFCFSEFVEMVQNRQPDLQVELAFDRFIKFGGFPGIHVFDWEEIPVRQFLESLFNTILLKDIVVRHNVRDVYMLEKISNFLIANCGSITSANNLSLFLKSQFRKISVETVQSYLAYARDALLAHQVKRYDLKGKRILESLEKYYVCDTGLRYALMGYPPENITGNLENIVFLELLSRGYKVFIGKLNGLEVDFIAEKGNEKSYFQVCLTLADDKTIDREYRALEAIDDHFPKYVLSLDSGFDTSRKGIRWMNVRDFLML